MNITSSFRSCKREFCWQYYERHNADKKYEMHTDKKHDASSLLFGVIGFVQIKEIPT